MAHVHQHWRLIRNLSAVINTLSTSKAELLIGLLLK
jgi:hypothetical protein